MTLLQTQSFRRSQADVSSDDLGQEGRAGSGSYVNVGNVERWASAILGGAIAVAGVRSRSVPGLLAAAAGGALVYRGVSGHCMGYAALGVNTAGSQNRADGAAPQQYFNRGIHVEQAMTVNRKPWELYEFWRNFENLPRFMKHVKSINVTDNTHSHWVVDGPAGKSVEWDAEIINDEPNALIAWRSLGGADVDNAGSVRFVPGPEGRGTEVRVVIDYIPPAGRIGNWISTLLGKNPSSEIREDLRRFKRVMETGEVPTIEGQPRGSCAGWGFRS